MHLENDMNYRDMEERQAAWPLKTCVRELMVKKRQRVKNRDVTIHSTHDSIHNFDFTNYFFLQNEI